jgi:FAD:protein FMN transferase
MAGSLAGARRVEHVMGTAIGVDVRGHDPADPALTAVLDRVFAHLRDVDARFSTYRADSEISRIGRGDLAEADASPDVRHVLAACDLLAATTHGAFDARRQPAVGGLDPSGYVKGWAVEEAAWFLDDAGIRDYVINAGGDVLARGHAAPGVRWRVGIRHPADPTMMAAVLEVTDRAVATSGTYERGRHIIDPRTWLPVTSSLESLTVVGPRLAAADAYATAAFVMGADGVRWVADQPDHEAFAITGEGRVLQTVGLDRYLASAA